MTASNLKPYENLTRPHTLVIFVLLMLGLYGFMIFQSSLWDRDETRFSSATLEMIASGDYIVPTYNSDLRPDKPILIYWLMSIGVSLLGPCEAGVRFFAPIGMLVSSLLTGWIGRRLFDPLTGFWAGAILATSGLMFMVGGAATTDSVLLAFMLTAITPAIFMLKVKPNFKHLLAMLLGLTGAMLTKGPVGLAIPLMAIGGIWYFGKQETRAASKKTLAWMMGLSFIATGLFLIWAIPANNATGGEFASQGIGHHVIDRIHTPQENHGGNFFLMLPYYIPVVVGTFMPWTLLLFGSIRAMVAKRLGDDHARAVLQGWFWPTFILMSCVATKLPHYILPVFPALAILVAAAISQLIQNPQAFTKEDRFWFEKGGTCYFPIIWFQGAVLMVGPILFWVYHGDYAGINLPPLIAAGIVCGVFQLAVSYAVLKAHKAQRYEYCAKLMLGTTAAFMAIFVMGFLPNAERILKISPDVVKIIEQKSDVTAPIAAVGYQEASLVFYINAARINAADGKPGKLPRGVHMLGRGDVLKWSKQNPTGSVIMRQQDWEQLRDEQSSLPLIKLGNRWGINVPKGKLMNVIVLKRDVEDNHTSEK